MQVYIVFLPQRAPLAPLWPLRAPTRTTPSFIMTCRRAFSLFFSLLFRRKAFFFQTFVSVDFSNLIYVCTRMLSLSIYRKHTKARRNQPCTNQQRNYVPTRARQRKQADRVDEREHVVEHLHSSLRSQNERRNRNLPGKNIQPLTMQQLKLV